MNWYKIAQQHTQGLQDSQNAVEYIMKLLGLGKYEPKKPKSIYYDCPKCGNKNVYYKKISMDKVIKYPKCGALK